MEKMLFLVFGLYIMQCALTYFQMKHFRTTVRDLTTMGYVGIGVKKHKMSAGNVIVLVSDDEGKIIEARRMKGMTLLARFKKVAQWQGRDFKDLRQEALNEKKQNKALLQALDQLEAHLNLNAA